MLLYSPGSSSSTTSNAVKIAYNLVNQDISPEEVDYFEVTLSIGLADSSESTLPLYNRVFNVELTDTTNTRQFWGASLYESSYIDTLSSYFDWDTYLISIVYDSNEWQVWVPNSDYIKREFKISADEDYSVDVEIVTHTSSASTTREFTSMINDVVDKRIADSMYMLIGVNIDFVNSSEAVTTRYTLDRTAKEILDAVESGKSVWVNSGKIYNTPGARALLIDITSEQPSRSESSSAIYFVFGSSTTLTFEAQLASSYPFFEVTP